MLNLALRPILESVGRAEMAAHCPVNPASLSSYDGQSNKSDFLDFGEGDMMVNKSIVWSAIIWSPKRLQGPVRQQKCRLREPPPGHSQYPRLLFPPGKGDDEKN